MFSTKLLFFVTIFFCAGCVGFMFALMGYTIPTKFVPMFLATPFAFTLVSVGSVGVFVMANSLKRRGAWFRLVIGFGMVVLAYIYLEALLFQTWSK